MAERANFVATSLVNVSFFFTFFCCVVIIDIVIVIIVVSVGSDPFHFSLTRMVNLLKPF